MFCDVTGTSDRDGAIREWTRLLGCEHVVCDRATLTQAESTTYLTTQLISAIICPGSREEVRECLKIANEFRAPIYPSSRGKNWGYGSRVPSSTGCAILSLERLDRIVNFDEKLGFVTIEPGVTFRQLNEFLRTRNSRFIAGCPGSTSEASIVGNALERGILQGSDAERWEQVAAIEANLPNGQVVRTGLTRFDARSAGFARAGIGPSLDGLFFQSNIGVVTEMTVWLQAKPIAARFFSFHVNDSASLPLLIDALQRARMDGLMTSCCTLLNYYRVLSCLRQYPYDEMGGSTPLSKEASRMFKAEYGLAEWMGTGSLIAAGQKELNAKLEAFQRHLAPVVDELTCADSGQPNPYIEDLQETGIALAYWRQRCGIPLDPDPDRDNCGIIWCSFVIPFDGDTFLTCCNAIERIMLAFGFEPSISLQCVTQRSVHVMAAICFDREIAGDDKSAIDCHHQIIRELAKKGLLPYRLAHCSYEALPPAHDDSASLIAGIKKTIDPHNILAPGRYQFLEWDQG